MSRKTGHFRTRSTAAILFTAILLLPGGVLGDSTVRGEHAEVISLEDNNTLAAEVLKYYEDSVSDLAGYFGFELEPGAEIVVTVSFDKLGEAGRLEHPIDPGVRAYVFPSTKKMFVYLDRTSEDVFNPLRVTVKHETFHIYMREYEKRAGVRFPDWFSEGTAQYFSEAGPFLQEISFFSCIKSGRAPRILQLDDFSKSGNLSLGEKYTMSFSFVRFLCEKHGRGVVLEIAERAAEGNPFDIAFYDATGNTIPEADDLWREELEGLRFPAFFQRFLSFYALFFYLGVLVIIGYFVARRRAARKKREWAGELEETDGGYNPYL